MVNNKWVSNIISNWFNEMEFSFDIKELELTCNICGFDEEDVFEWLEDTVFSLDTLKDPFGNPVFITTSELEQLSKLVLKEM